MQIFSFNSADASDAYLELMAGIRNNDGVECAQFPDIFFPVDWELGTQSNNLLAKQICERCPVKMLCLEYAMLAEDEAGTWGGYTALERKQMRQLARLNPNPS